MRVTYKGDYALKAILDLSLHYDDVVTIHELAKNIDAPVKFLEQVLLELKRAGFVESRRGKIGGYLLAKPPAEITVGDVVRFIEGPIDPIDCLEKNYNNCKDTLRCAFRPIFHQVAEATSRIIDGVTFDDLSKKIQSEKKEINYSI